MLIRATLVDKDPVDVAVGLWRREEMGTTMLIQTLEGIATTAEMQDRQISSAMVSVQACDGCVRVANYFGSIVGMRAARARALLRQFRGG